MGGTKMLVALVLCLIVSTTMGQSSYRPKRSCSDDAMQCRINRLTSSEPSDRIECEGGLIELWDENEDQYLCSGVHAMRVTVQPNSLTLPNFFPFPRLVYIERGEGIMGVTFPGCPETYQSEGREEERIGEGERGFRESKDLHQKVHRFKRGDVLAIPPGAVHWCYNDGPEDIVAVHVTDLKNPSNQLDASFRAFYLAGGAGRSSQGRERQSSHYEFSNIFSVFDTSLMAEAFGVPEEVISRMQQTQDRSFIIRAEKGEMRILAPKGECDTGCDEEEHETRRSSHGRAQIGLMGVNGLEESICTMKLRHSTLNRKDSDVYTRRGGRLNIVNEHKLPILKHIDMSLEKGHMYPNTLYSPHWAVNSHSIIYVLNGDAHIQVVSNEGETIMNDRVSEGEMFVIPQYFAVSARAGNNGFEYVSFKTTSSPMKSPLVGYTSVFRAMPVQVLINSYQISPRDAQELKYNRQHQTFFLPARGGQSTRL
ncbi:11S globulin seed storage protein 2-like [Amaranthus tricolor]|uniref:11S globulin seed storage protein 2-like n=1 Tax=Amaranthus tricolor TaxID=29722 RepID=UPI00258CDB92|nr:11S globulin seed storage protein 2-like [Amaranthus tricolor]